ncbi:hypothetical protein A2U01_0078312, partial [Trifolium medium]|nr:hypothetical protein [Trifolium medium]
MPHPAFGPSPHQSHPADVDDVPDSPDSKHPKHGSDAPTVSWFVSENAQSGQSVVGTAGSMTELGHELCSPAQQSSVGESSVVILSP